MTTNADLAKAWYEGQLAGEWFAEARAHWVFNGGERPQRRPCPYPASPTSVNCEAATQLFEQHKGR